MGELILFPHSRAAARSDRAEPRLQDATILFFTGVRYNREVEKVPVVVEQESPPKGGLDGTGGRRRKRRG